MPKNTFFNLSPDKRERIMQIAIEEFALNEYRSASLTKIVEKAGIAKGSMYQYFENKKDLYVYLIENIANEKLASINAFLNSDSKDFFKRLTEINILSAKWDFSHPNESRLILNAMKETNSEELGSLPSQILQMSDSYIANFIKDGQDSGELRTDLPVDLLSFLVSRISVSLSDYISHKYGSSYEQIIRKGAGRLPIREEHIEEVLNDLIKFLRTGLQAHSEQVTKN